MTPSLAGQLAVLTGAGREPGAGLALALGRAGARVVLVDLNPAAVQRVADMLTAAGAEADVQIVDVANKLAVQTLLYTLLEAHPRLDLLINAASHAPRTPALRLDEAEWNRTLDVTLKGAFLMAQTVARAMQATGGGVIINVLRPEAELPAALRAATAGLRALTAALAVEWAPLGVRVAALSGGEPAAASAALFQLLAAPQAAEG